MFVCQRVSAVGCLRKQPFCSLVIKIKNHFLIKYLAKYFAVSKNVSTFAES